MSVGKVVLAYSGGLDTSIIVPWLKENYGCQVITYTADLGQQDELEGLAEKAYASGADKVYIEDLKNRFVTDYAFPILKAGAIYEGRYLLGTSFARPLIAKRQIEIAEDENADAVAHGCTGKGNDQVRFELTYQAINPKIKVIAPWREWDLRSREDEIAYAQKHNIPIPESNRSFSHDQNLWHRSTEGGLLEDPWNPAPDEAFILTADPEDAPEQPEIIKIDFAEGIPISLNGKKLRPVELLTTLNQIAGKHGIGRVDMVENRLVGMKSRGVYETPGGTILVFAHRELESLVLDGQTLHYKQKIGQDYAELVYYGLWFSPLKRALDAFIEKTQRVVTGSVRLKLYKGNLIVLGRSSPYSLYREDLATFEEDGVYDQTDARGFINLYGLPLKVNALLRMDGKFMGQPVIPIKRD